MLSGAIAPRDRGTGATGAAVRGVQADDGADRGTRRKWRGFRDSAAQQLAPAFLMWSRNPGREATRCCADLLQDTRDHGGSRYESVTVRCAMTNLRKLERRKTG
jgi:hypothetical protein